ncbi:MAG TPA: hypothetical protein VIL30_22595 [Ramlibacter sp.]|jgi:hypothetical protein
MAAASSLKYWVPGLLALAAVLATCGTTPPEAPPDATRDRLPGTWLREYEADGVKARRVLKLDADGAFFEKVRATDAAGRSNEQVHEGTWLYDGTNLKRRYTSMNGKPPSRLNLPIATFEVSFPSRDEFLGVDHIHGNRVHYRRVAAGTQP